MEEKENQKVTPLNGNEDDSHFCLLPRLEVFHMGIFPIDYLTISPAKGSRRSSGRSRGYPEDGSEAEVSMIADTCNALYRLLLKAHSSGPSVLK